MPRYFFNIYDGFAQQDEVGKQLDDLAAAQRESIFLISEMLAPESAAIWRGEEWRIEVTNNVGHVIFNLQFKASLEAAKVR